MKETDNRNFELILIEEDKLLNEMILKQQELRKTVANKDWQSLLSVISQINLISDSFQKLDTKRDELQSELTREEYKNYLPKLGELRRKLTKCKVENHSLSEYVNVTKDFIQSVIDDALPQKRAKVYSRDGNIVKNQPQSVVLDCLY
ncbi:MAG: hypothetical protein E7060_05285 [Treponema bryantii]|jgi:hypothetical protein|nr:hypothetical protein [Treponema bryantii]